MVPISRTRHHRETREFRCVVCVFVEWVCDLWNEWGWTVEDAAERFGVEPAFVRRVEAGRTNPSVAVVVSIAKAFGIRIADLMTESDVAQAEGSQSSTRVPAPGAVSKRR